MLTAQQIRLAARIRKVVRLAGTPGMDAVAVKLNSDLTGEEMTEAKRWALAFELAAGNSGGDLYELALLYNRQSKDLC